MPVRKTKKTTRKKAKISPEDLYRLNLVTGIRLSPDESRVAYTLERIDKQQRKYFTNIHLLDITSGESRQFTHGDNADSQPVWSHDGATLAFVSTRDKKTGIYLMPTDGGAERQVLEIEGHIQGMQFSPDDSHLVFSLQYKDSHFIKDEEKKKEQPVYRHITRLFYRLDGAGFLPRKPFQVFTLELETAKLKQLTKGSRDNQMPTTSPNGKWIAYVSNRHPKWELEFLQDDLFVIPFGGGKEKKVTTPPGPVMWPKFSPDSKKIAYSGHDNPQDDWGSTNTHVWTVGINGRPAAKDLMPGFDRSADDSSIADMEDVHGSDALCWSADGKRLFFLCSDTGVTNLFSIPASGGKPTRIFKGQCHIKSFSTNGRTRTGVAVRADLSNPGDLFTFPLQWEAEKKGTKQTDLNKFLRTDIGLGRTKEVWFKSFDGTEVQGWLLTPPGFNANRKYPAILQVHGGPRAQYAFSFFHEMQYLAAQGYVVLYTNPRGGTGRGETWAAAISGGWGDLDYKDCMAATDYLERLKFVNSKRLGVTGGSYGGYMTNWIIGHTDRFKAAVTQRSVVELKSFYGASDIGFSLEREFTGLPWSKDNNYDLCSPYTYFTNVKTPVLIIHSEQDLRCNIEQAEHMYAMLKRLGKKVEMVRFPEEPHGLSRHGRPDRRIARLEWIYKWFKKYL